MAVLTKELYRVDGKDYEVKLRCNSQGVFSADLERSMAEPLNLKTKLTAASLSELKGQIVTAVKKLAEAQLCYEVYLRLKYGGSGPYQIDHDTKLDTFGTNTPAVGFDFDVVIKETGGEKDRWYFSREYDKERAERTKEYGGRYPDAGFGFTTGQTAGSWGDPPSGKIIAYSPTAEASLKKAVDTLVSLSKLIHGFYTQDEEEITNVLTSGSFLALPGAKSEDDV